MLIISTNPICPFSRRRMFDRKFAWICGAEVPQNAVSLTASWEQIRENNTTLWASSARMPASTASACTWLIISRLRSRDKCHVSFMHGWRIYTSDLTNHRLVNVPVMQSPPKSRDIFLKKKMVSYEWLSQHQIFYRCRLPRGFLMDSMRIFIILKQRK